TNYPGPSVLANGFFIGSDSAGNSQAHGMFDDIDTYNVPLQLTNVMDYYAGGLLPFYGNPLNAANFLQSAPSVPSSSPWYFNVVSGPGYLTNQTASASCSSNSQVWMTNVSVTTTGGLMTFNFAIAGGTPGWMYDVFGAGGLTVPLTNAVWSWLGQGGACSNYSVPGLTNLGAIFILGTPLDSDGDGDGLTDAYELLASHSNPYSAYTG